MCTRLGSIKEKKREFPLMIVGPEDFAIEPGEKIEPEAVLANPAYSLYCFDRANGSAIFVECPENADIVRQPFYYQAQYEAAVRVATMPMADFLRVGHVVKPPVGGLIFVHSVGRCGSTLISKVLDAVPSVHSLSEPDDLTQMISFRDGSNDVWMQDILKASIGWRCKPRWEAAPSHVAIKTRSEVLTLGDLLVPLFPRAKHPFLYRDAVTWMGSYFRTYPSDRDIYDPESNRQGERFWRMIVPLIDEYVNDEAPLNPVEVRVLGWIMCMEAYLRLVESGMVPFAIRFKDLTAHPREMVDRFLKFCGIEDVDWSEIDAVLGRDSQAGTFFDREARKEKNRELTPELLQDLNAIVATRPRLRTADFTAPGTVEVSADETR